MCGLVVSTLGSSISESAWSESINQIECRGPDDVGDELVGSIRFGHRRLEIIGLGSVGHQPYVGVERDDALAFNGEIYNFRELGREIGMAADSDTEVLHALLHERDFGRLDRMRGMYAWVYFDARNGELITARDPFGIKPLYQRRHDNGEISFASVPACLSKLGSHAGPSATGIAGFLAAGYFRVGETAFDGIQKSPVGQITVWSKRSGSWRTDTRAINWTSTPVLTVEDALTDSVRMHLTSDVPVGVLMSGGVDSTLIAALAARDNNRLQSFCLVNPDNPEIDEAAYARNNARLIGLDHTEVPVTASRLADEMPRLIASSGEPFGDAAFLPLSVLSSEVAKHVKVALAGEGADELFGGYKRYQIERPLHVPGVGTTLGVAGRFSQRFSSRLPISTQGTRTLKAWGEGSGYRGHSYLFSAEWDAVGGCLPEATRLALNQRERDWEDLANDPFAYGLPTFQAFDLRQWLPNNYLEKSDRASMRSSLEVRVPFLDPLVAASIGRRRPWTSKKRPLRKLLHELVPGVQLPPRKMGLTVASGAVLGTPALSSVLRDLRESPNGVLQSMGATNLDQLWARADRSDGLKFRLATLGIWADQWLS